MTYPIEAAAAAIVDAFRARGLAITPEAARQWATAEQGVNGNILGVTYVDSSGKRRLATYGTLAAGARAAADRVATLDIYAPLRTALRPGVPTSAQLEAIIQSPWNRRNSPYYRRVFTGESGTGAGRKRIPGGTSAAPAPVNLFPITPTMTAAERAAVYVQRLQYAAGRGPLSAAQQDALARYAKVAARQPTPVTAGGMPPSVQAAIASLGTGSRPTPVTAGGMPPSVQAAIASLGTGSRPTPVAPDVLGFYRPGPAGMVRTGSPAPAPAPAQSSGFPLLLLGVIIVAAVIIRRSR